MFKMNKISNISIFLTSIILFVGCTSAEVSPKKKTTKKELSSLNKQVTDLDDKSKQQIYHTIKEDIKSYKEKGDKALSFEYYAEAIKAYEMVNFYEAKEVVSLKKIKKIALSNSAMHYKKALKYKNKDTKKFIIELNQVMINDTEYKDSKVLLNKAKTDMWEFFKTKEDKLYKKLRINSGSLKDLKALRVLANDLRQYEYNNNNVVQADKELQKYYKIFLDDARDNYKKGNYKQAKKGFEGLLSLNKKDAVAKQYLKKMRVVTKQEINMNQAKKALENSQYKEAIVYAKKVLRVDDGNTQAKKIIEQAKNKRKERVKHYLSKGKMEYKNKDLDKAKESFEKVLGCESSNAEALVYYNKISRQLQTISNLQ